MSRILEFQPTDEQTIVARVLVELHQAIDVSFPNVKPSERQFSRTVLTHQGETTRADNMPHLSDERQGPGKGHEDSLRGIASQDQISMTPRSGMQARGHEPLLHTAQIRTLLGENYYSRLIKRALISLLTLGLAVLAWLIFVGTQWPWAIK